MAGVGLLDGVHREDADRVDCQSRGIDSGHAANTTRLRLDYATTASAGLRLPSRSRTGSSTTTPPRSRSSSSTATSAAWPWITAPTSRRSSARWKPISRPSASDPRRTHSVGPLDVAEHLQLAPEELREEDGQRVVGRARARQLPAEVRALRVGVRPVLDAAVPPRRRVGIAGDVADRVDVGQRGAEPLVDDDPVVDVRPRLLGELDVRHDADTDDREVALDRLARPSCAPRSAAGRSR